ncbi:uncharacterized protein PFLUO_LOCUS4649 [Penicillium psychrofluorescens]|uniref:uncharacterized protein n=1 Tax=Penicillium psychrofluorescens TaxID=3158075 RepID=UPI003CCD9FD9
MRGSSSWAALQRSRRQLCAHRLLPQPAIRHHHDLSTTVSEDANARPSPSELLRFSVTGAIEPRYENQPNLYLQESLRGLFDQEWYAGIPPAPLWNSLRELPLPQQKKQTFILNNTSRLSTLRSIVERYVKDRQGAQFLQSEDCRLLSHALRRCARHYPEADIMLVLRDIIAKLQRIEAPILPELYALGMRYAMLSLDASALAHFVKGFSRQGHRKLSDKMSTMVAEPGSKVFSAAYLEDPRYNSNPMLAMITGEGEAGSQNQIRLHDLMEWNVCYIQILARLGSRAPLQDAWNYLMDHGPGKVPSDQIRDLWFSCYSVVSNLIHAGRSTTALSFLEDIAQRNGNRLPFIRRFNSLRILLDDPIVGEGLPHLITEHEYVRILEREVSNMEQRMGIEWDDERQTHTAPSSTESTRPPPFGDEPLITIDGDCQGYDNQKRLFHELEASMFSKSPIPWGRAVDILNDCDERPCHFADPSVKNAPWRVRFLPQHSPIEFSDSQLPVSYDSSRPWTPSTLGLMRAHQILNGVPQTGHHCLHLLQLGTLEIQHLENSPWERTGYIVTWDRINGNFLAVNVGQSTGVIDPGPAPKSGPFGSVMPLMFEDRPYKGRLQVGWFTADLYLDMDPSPDLGF